MIGGTKKEIGVEVDNLTPAVLVKMFEKINHSIFYGSCHVCWFNQKTSQEGVGETLVKEKFSYYT